MIVSMKVMLRPNNKQRTKLFRYAGTARFSYNWALHIQRENYSSGGKFLSDGELRKRFTRLKKTKDHSWLNTVSNNVAKQAIKDACYAYKRFFKGHSQFPKFKSKRKSTPSFYQDTEKIRFTATHVKVEGFAASKKKNRQSVNWIRLAETNRILFGEHVKYMNPRFTFDGLSWWVSVGIEIDIDPVLPQTEGVGIDLGIKETAVCSNGTIYPNINHSKKVKRLEMKKRRLQRNVSRKYEMSREGNRYQKTRNTIRSEQQLLIVSRRLTNIRHNYVHQTTSEIVDRKPKFIVLEDLNVSGMLRNKHLAKAVQQQCFHEFRRQIEYKCKRYGIRFILADRWFPSSKLCSKCGQSKKDLRLSERLFECPCGNRMERDQQAALNLQEYGQEAIQSTG